MCVFLLFTLTRIVIGAKIDKNITKYIEGAMECGVADRPNRPSDSFHFTRFRFNRIRITVVVYTTISPCIIIRIHNTVNPTTTTMTKTFRKTWPKTKNGIFINFSNWIYHGWNRLRRVAGAYKLTLIRKRNDIDTRLLYYALSIYIILNQ